MLKLLIVWECNILVLLLSSFQIYTNYACVRFSTYKVETTFLSSTYYFQLPEAGMRIRLKLTGIRISPWKKNGSGSDLNPLANKYCKKCDFRRILNINAQTLRHNTDARFDLIWNTDLDLTKTPGSRSASLVAWGHGIPFIFIGACNIFYTEGGTRGWNSVVSLQ